MESRSTGCTVPRIGVISLCVAILACSGEGRESEDYPTQPPGGTSQIAGIPSPWFGGSSINPAEYEIGRDLAVVHGGHTSAYVRSRGAVTSPNTFGTLTQLIRAENYRGQRVRYSGHIRVADVTGGGVGLWIRTDVSSGQRSFDNMSARRLLGNQDWSYVEVVIDVPDKTVGIAFGVLISGPGIGWVDDLKLEIVSTDIPVTVPLQDATSPGTLPDVYETQSAEPLNLDFEGVQFPESQSVNVDWMRNNSVTFETDDPMALDHDLEPLRAMVGDAQLVALGEATHGTREFFRMKHRVFRYLVEHLGFDHFSIEASLPEALAVDRYVQTGEGDPAVLVRGMRFWTWSTQEVIDLVRWMREWNAAGNQPRLRFSGFDMQFPDVAMDSVVAFTRSLSVALGDSVRAAYQCLYARKINGLVSQVGYQIQTQSIKDSCRGQLQLVDSLFARRVTEWSAATDADRTILMQRLARLVSQWEDNARNTSGAIRDQYMAENVAWWKSRAPAGSRAVLWAHNLHVSRKSQWMGQHLGTQFGAGYLNIGLTFSAGSFNAVFQNSSGGFGALTAHGIAGSEPQSIEALLDATGRDRAIFDARAMKASGTPGGNLRNRLTMRSIGSAFNPIASPAAYQLPTSLPNDYDILIWFRNASASRLSLQ